MPNARARGNFLTDAAEPDEAERLAPQLDAGELLLVPHAALHGRVRGRNGSRERKHQRERVFGDAHAVGARGVHDDDAARCCSGDIDVVDTGSRAGNHPKFRRCCNQRLVDGRRAADDEGVRIGEIAREVSGRAAGFGVDGTAGKAREQSDRGGRQLIGDDDVHGVTELVR